MPKRARSCGMGSGNCFKSILNRQSDFIRYSGNKAPQKGSVSLQEHRDRGVQQSHRPHLPSPSPTQPQEQIRKRKQPTAPFTRQDQPCPKKPRTSEDRSGATPIDDYNPIENWVKTGQWPTNFIEKGFDMKHPLSSAESSSKKKTRTLSYSQRVREGKLPMQYTGNYEKWLLAAGLDMDRIRGKDHISEESRKLCEELKTISRTTIKPIIYPSETIYRVVNQCKDRNEAIVLRDITPMIVPPITSLYFGGNDNLEHVIDEVNANWDIRCVLAGPRPRPDLAVGLSSTAFTFDEINKLNCYAAIDNWARFTDNMYFPFLMCEVKCAEGGLDAADRQNMHSSSIALKALIKIEQEADRYRDEQKASDLYGRTLVFSISHNSDDARLYGHYALVQNGQWFYYRYSVGKFDLTDSGLLALYNFVQNLFKSYPSKLMQRLKDALAVLPDSAAMSFGASAMSLNDENSQQNLQGGEEGGFAVPGRPASAMLNNQLNGEIAKLIGEMTKMRELMEMQREKMEKERKEQREKMEKEQKEEKEKMEKERKEEKDKMEKERKEEKDKMEKQINDLIKHITNPSETNL